MGKSPGGHSRQQGDTSKRHEPSILQAGRRRQRWSRHQSRRCNRGPIRALSTEPRLEGRQQVIRLSFSDVLGPSSAILRLKNGFLPGGRSAVPVTSRRNFHSPPSNRRWSACAAALKEKALSFGPGSSLVLQFFFGLQRRHDIDISTHVRLKRWANSFGVKRMIIGRSQGGRHKVFPCGTGRLRAVIWRILSWSPARRRRGTKVGQ